MRWTLPLALAAVLISAPAWADSKNQPRLGVQAEPMTKELRRFFGAPANAGVLVSRVTPDSPASRANLRVGDVITAVDERRVDDAHDLRAAFREKKKRDMTRLSVVRDKKRIVINVRCDPQAQTPPRAWPKEWQWRWPGDRSSPEGKSFDELRKDVHRQMEELHEELGRSR